MRKLFISFFCILTSLLLTAIERPSYVTLTTEDGLASNTINYIYKDYKGFTWIGTANGLNRFDGIDILTFNEFKNKSVISIAEPDNTYLYVLTEKNLFKYNRKYRKNTLIKIADNKSQTLKSLALDKNQDLYIVSDKGLYCLHKNSETAIKIGEKDIPESLTLTNIHIDSENICWITSSNGLIKYDIANKEIRISHNAINNEFICLVENKNKIYLATSNSEIILFNTITEEYEKLISIDTPYIQTISYNKGKLYIGTNGNGLKIVDLKSKEVSTIMHKLSAPNSALSTNAIYSILVEDSTFWLGTFSGGITYIPYKREIFKVFSDKERTQDSSLNIRSFIIDSDGYGIYGTRNGLIYNKDGEKQHYTTENTPELKSNIILSIFPFNEENYLIGTYSGGVYFFNKKEKKIKKFKEDPIFSENSFYSIIQDQEEKNIIWFGSLLGLIRYDRVNSSYKIFNTSNSPITSNDIYFLLIDSSNRIWIATKEGVCFMNKKGEITKLSIPNLPQLGIVRHLYEDSNRNIWLGCENQGAFKIAHDLSKFKHYTSLNILPGNYVSSIIEDNKEQIWFTTSKGMVSYKNDSEYTIYSLTDGLPGYTFNDGAVQKTENNRIWWGNEKGLIFLNPLAEQEVRTDEFYITRIVIDGFMESAQLNSLKKAPEYLDTIQIPTSENSLIFKFTDLLYDYPSSTIYEYMLEGHDDTWHKTVEGKEILIPKISGGKYTLKIRNAGNNQTVKSTFIIKNKSYTIISIAISFILFLIIIIILYKYILHKYKKKSTEKVDKEKYQHLKIEKKEIESIKQAITNFMEKEKPYLNPNFKLEDIASAINYPKTKISQVLNIHLNTNFSNFVSTYRIEAFKEKAKEGMLEQYTLSALARECGFSSRSSFFHTMKKITGKTPSEFLKDAGIVSSSDE
ncbi:MAG: helix-turn-helix domain-containing protein [Bacteroidales bacterium]|nr:helix-turn-helix domain-containing protein [Bacteroidales bacterium]